MGLPPSKMHREISVEFCRIIASDDVERFAFAAPRGNAKTTYILAFILFCVCYGLKRFVIYITSTAELANVFLGDIKTELESNDRLLADFPDVCGRGRVWRENVIVTRNGVKIQPLGAGKKIRGRKHGPYRPDLVVTDDIEDDEHVRNIDQRNKLFSWFTKAVLKARGVAQKCDFIITGTLLHFDSLLSRIVDPRKSPGWRSRIYKAVISWASNQSLWDQWEALYTDWHKPDEARLGDAHAFFLAHAPEMLVGTQVLWPEGEPYYDLMRQRVDEGPSAFGSEKQNEPLDPSQCEFPEEWFEFFDEVESAGEWWLVPDKGDRIRLADCDVFGALDPSKGRRDRHGDPSALISIAAYPSQHLARYQGRYQTFWVLDGEVEWRHPHIQEQRIFELHGMRRYQRFGVEAVQFQELFADLIQQHALSDPSVQMLQIVRLTPISDKALRIQKLGPYINAARLKFTKKAKALYEQLRYFPQHAHDDGPDAVELCLETIGEIGWVMLDYDKPTGGDADERKDGYLKQVVRQFAQHFDADDDGATCGKCSWFAAESNRCKLRQLGVGAQQPACDAYEGRT